VQNLWFFACFRSFSDSRAIFFSMLLFSAWRSAARRFNPPCFGNRTETLFAPDISSGMLTRRDSPLVCAFCLF